MAQSIVCNDDIKWLEQRSPQEITMIVGQMTSLLEAIADTKNDTDAKVAKIQNQGWFIRLWSTITGKNKATKEEIRRNQDKIVGYISQAVAKLFELNLIEMQAIQSLGNRINQVYAQLTEYYNEQLHMKAQIAEIQNIQQETIKSIGEIASNLNEKIDSIDNFHMLRAEIEQGKCKSKSRIYSMCSVLAQLDKRTINDDRKMEILKVDLQRFGIVTFKNVSLKDCIMEVLSLSDDEVGNVYLELSNYSDSFPANIIVRSIEEYHFLSKLEKRLKKKRLIIDNILNEYDVEEKAVFSYYDIFEGLLEVKANSFTYLKKLTMVSQNCNNRANSDLELFSAYKETIEHNSVYDSEDEIKPIEYVDENIQLYWKGIYKDWDFFLHLSLIWDIDTSFESVKFFNAAAKKGNRCAQFRMDFISFINKNQELAYQKAYKEEEQRLRTKYSRHIDYKPIASTSATLKRSEYLFPILDSWLKGHANNNNEEAQYLLGKLYDIYHNRTKSEQILMSPNMPPEVMPKRPQILMPKGLNDETIKWFEKAANHGHIPSQYELWCNDFRHQNENTIKWIQIAASAGFAPAQIELGKFYSEGKFFQKDLKKAFYWYLNAARQGFDEAAYEVAKSYAYGKGVKKDAVKAKRWYEKSNRFHGRWDSPLYL